MLALSALVPEVVVALVSDLVFVLGLKAMMRSTLPAQVCLGVVRVVLYQLLIWALGLPFPLRLPPSSPLCQSLAVLGGALANMGLTLSLNTQQLNLREACARIRVNIGRFLRGNTCLLLLVPLCEELFYRHFLLLRLQSVIGTGPATLTQALWFASNHSTGGLRMGILRTCRSLVYAAVALCSGGFWASVVCHCLNNVLALLLGDSSPSSTPLSGLVCNGCGKNFRPGDERLNCVSCVKDVMNFCRTCHTVSGPHKQGHEMVLEPVLKADVFSPQASCAQSLLHAFQVFGSRPCLGQPTMLGFQWSSYSQVCVRAMKFGSGLAGRLPDGLERANVGVCGLNCAEWIIADCALLMRSARFVVIPLPVPMAASGEAALKDVLAQVSLRCVIADSQFRGPLERALKESGSVPLCVWWGPQTEGLSFAQVEDAGDSDLQTSPCSPDEVATIVFTSGTQGTSKGALWTSALLNYSACQPLQMSPLVVFDFQPLEHAFSRRQVLRTLCNGGRLALNEGRQDLLFDRLRQARPTFLGAPPAFWDSLLKEFEGQYGSFVEGTCEEALARYRSSLPLGNRIQALLCGGAASSPRVHAFLRAAFQVPVADGYATTETGTIAVNGVVPPEVDSVLLPETGEICVCSPLVIPGYLGGEVEDKFVIIKGKRYFRTGDLGERVDGGLRIRGRLAEAFKLSQGEFVVPSKVEAALTSSPKIRQAFVWGDSLRSHVVAVIVPFELQLDEAECLAEVRKTSGLRGLQAYETPQMVLLEPTPFTPDNGLLTASLKLKRPQLLAKYREPLLRLYTASSSASSSLSPVLSLMQTVLPAQICAGHSFAQLGGDSLSALRFIAALKQRNISVSLVQLLQLADVTTLETVVGNQSPSPAIQWEQEWTYSGTSIDSDTDEAGSEGEHKTGDSSEAPGSKTSDEAELGEPEGVLLTGATGFFGPFVAFELLNQCPTWKVVCLVRAESDQGAWLRLKQQAQMLQVWNEDVVNRLQVLKGDVSAPRFGLTSPAYRGLTRSVHCVVHNAARVHGILPYRDLKSVNVVPIPAIVRFCGRGRAKTLLHVSSVNVLRPPDHHPEVVLSSVTCPSLALAPGYAQSKYVAERLLESCVSGIQQGPRAVVVVRPATIGAHSLTGACNLNDFTSGYIKGHILLGCYPESLRGIPENLLLTPVDFVSRALVRLLRHHCGEAPSATVSCYHLSTPVPCTWPDLVQFIRSFGYRFPAVSDEEYVARLQGMQPSNPLFMFQEQLLSCEGFRSLSHAEGPSQDRTLAILQDGAGDWPQITEAMFHRQLAFMQRQGALPPAPNPCSPSEGCLQPYLDCPFYRLEHWYPALESLTFPTTFFPLSPSTQQALRRLRSDTLRQRIIPEKEGCREYVLRVAQAGLSTTGKTQAVYSLTSHEEEEGWLQWQGVLDAWGAEAKAPLLELLAMLDQHLRRFGSSAFVRLSTRSPKDAALLSPKYKRLMNEGESPAHAVYRALEVFSALDVLSLFLRSERVFQDLRLCERMRHPVQVCVRRFSEFDPEWEFRAFVFGGRLTAISHYRQRCSPSLAIQHDRLTTSLEQFWHTQVRGLVPVSDYTVDLVVVEGNMRVVEINYPAPIASTILFDWDNPEDRKIVTQGPYELRMRP